MIEYRNPTYNADGTIDVEINHPDYGWIPFTASPDDTEPHGRQIFEDLKAEAAEYVEPEPPEPQPEPVPQTISRFQARAALHQAGYLAQMQTAIESADPIVKMAWEDATEFRRNSPTVLAFAETLGLTDEQLDEMFRTAAQIEA